jgi:signal peptidase II
MLYFPIIKSHYPGWFPFVGGDEFEFFSPVFNIADASISIGVIALFLFQKRFVRKLPQLENPELQQDTNTERLSVQR